MRVGFFVACGPDGPRTARRARDDGYPPGCRRNDRSVEPGDPAGPRRHLEVRLRRDLRGAVPHPELCLRLGRAGRGALQERSPGLHLQPLRQPHRRHVRGAHAAARRRRGGPRHRHRHGGRHRRPAVLPQGRRPRRGGARPVRLVPLRGGGLVSALRHRLHAGRWPRHRRLAEGRAAQHQGVLLRDAGQSDARSGRYRRRGRDRPRRRRRRGGRQRVRHADAAEAAEARRRRRGLFGHQAHRRPGPLPRRRRAGLRVLRQGPPAQLPEAHRAVAQPVQRLGDAEGPGDAALSGFAPSARPRPGSPTTWPDDPRSSACCSAAAPTIRRRRWPGGR